MPETATLSHHYDEAYYLNDGRPQNTFALTDRTLARAQAIAEATQLLPDNRVLDYGCGLGAMTAAFNILGYQATGVDPSPHAVANAVPQAKPHIRQLSNNSLSGIRQNYFELAFAKDVFEHVPKDDIPELRDNLLRVAQKLLLVIPLVGEDGKFIFGLYEHDPTHITRLTGEKWLEILAGPGITMQPRHDLTPRIRRRDKIAGTLSVLLLRQPARADR